ncbi:FAST kinase domain-containing protein 5, mitochondrial-like [Contarinia nasturtii]|uniref:FAST kinase domain-containing protein 5, mitochondrial-like n=1 Tax=Contarinia nasturtii TaxID=265458 RepID=UPI0012D3D9C7|nr:FAST kinase domain-containing protein 5, mitochondrial-like [Contarinia nasturtii]
MTLFTRLCCYSRLCLIDCNKFRIFRTYCSKFNEQKQNKYIKYARKVLQQTKGCVLFNASKFSQYIISPKEFRAENQIIYELVLAARKNCSKNTHKLLDNRCADNYKTWPINEQLFALDVWYFVKHRSNFQFFEATVRDFLSEFHSLENGPALQILYYVGQMKLQLSAVEADSIVNHLKNNIDQITFDEVSMQCSTLIKCDCKVDDTNLIKSLYTLLLTSDLQRYDSIAVSGIIKFVRRFSSLDHISELEALQNKLTSYVDAAGHQTGTHIIQMGVKQGAFDTDIIETVIQRFSKNMNELRNKDVERVLLSISTRNYRSENGIELEFCNLVQKYLLNSLDTNFPDSVINCITYLAIFGVADAKLIDWALRRPIDNIEKSLLVIDSYAKINLATTYNGHKLSENVCADLMKKASESTTAGKKSNLVYEVSDVLKAHDIYHILTRAIPYVPFNDLFFIYNKRTRDTVNILQPNADGHILNVTNIIKNNPDLEGIAIVPCKNIDSVYNAYRYKGLMQFKLNQLEMNGFKTIAIRSSTWKKYNTEAAKRRYLAMELCKNDVFLFKL